MDKSRPPKSPTVPVRHVNRAQATNYLRKPEQHLAESLEALSAKRWDTAALLVIHAAIAAVDAACVASGGVRSAAASLADVDHFLRETWLECCGHLSAFTIHGKEYLSDTDDGYDDETVEGMDFPIGAMLERGNKFHHLYDVGTATELTLKIVSRREASVRNRRIRLLARNEAPAIPCEVCGNVAVWVCSQCLDGAVGWVCNKCAGQHDCGREMLLPVVNSPRVGMCGYTGAIEFPLND